MDGTSHRRFRRKLGAFWWENGRLLLFLTLFLLGVGIGCSAFDRWSETADSLLTALFGYPAKERSFSNVLTVFGHAFLWQGSVLLVLMTAGLSVIGAPFVPAAALLYGLGIGLKEAYWLAAHGVGRMAALTLLPTLIALWAVLMAACESFRMTLRLAGQIFPHASASGLWTEFKRYLLRYCIFFGLGLLSAAVQTALVLGFG